MIPKRLIFVWLGDVPEYANYCIENFHKINPDYEIMKFFFTDEDVMESKNLKGKILDFIAEDEVVKRLERYKVDKNYLESYKNNTDIIYKIMLSVSIRYRMLYRYGGIYLDCDTFPIKPFDDKLLELNKFSCVRGDNDNKTLDCFFMGLDTKYKLKEYQWNMLPTKSGYTTLYDNLKFRRKCYKFRKCKIKYGEHFNDPNIHYIDHYWYRTRTKY